MILNQAADIRTGIVVARKKATSNNPNNKLYKMINLKCINEKGYIKFENTEVLETEELISKDFQTQIGDIIVRLSAPYTAAIIHDAKEEGYIIPSHFAIIRADNKRVVPEYLLWLIRSSRVQQQIRKNNSGSSGFGTISSGFFVNLEIQLPPIERQQRIGKMLLLSEREQELLYKLAEEKSKYANALFEIINKPED